MNRDPDPKRRFEEDEAWLRLEAEAEAPVDAARIKARVRQELAARKAEPRVITSTGAASVERAGTGRTAARHARRVLTWGTAGLGVAAALALVWMRGVAPERAPVGSPAGFTYVEAFESFDESDLDAEIEDLAGMADELDSDLAQAPGLINGESPGESG